ncbi:GGDEF domain-containing protein [Deinococcus peraridilitoris]|uniref:Diguanylate cyclase (GGDEF) domain-containing protein n=1 Tax=Deinococcus peraridilitoris (strain DSM 19664 / LMG 22246 / CIP 109416 / KR-200) TaxID=937777 RepID=L0A1R4_DEIPD|nr:GGDEF domain-containing protein [Deinococcus peraridilitoris]AFZ67843.1 diguanylate cyclase (GGDEF) domain-containing protein [Deinococcus peraridilitoris DSM 19664]
MPPHSGLLNPTKQRVSVLSIALALLALLAWWVYTHAYDGNNLLLLISPPLLSLCLLWALATFARGDPAPRTERYGFALLYLFAILVFVSRVLWPTPQPLRGLENTLLIIVSLTAYLQLQPRAAVVASGALYAVMVTTGWAVLASEDAGHELWFAALIRQTADLTVIVLLYSLVWLRQWGAEESSSRLQLQRLADTDALTDLPNRRGMYRVLEQVMGSMNFSVVLVDVDRFKAVNDDLGHAVGDLVLRGVADALRTGVRDGDEVGRWGGEEFLVVLPRAELPDVLQVAERLRFQVEQSDLLPGRGITASFGVAVWRAGDSLEDLLRRADEALYCAKREGRNRVCAENDERTAEP